MGHLPRLKKSFGQHLLLASGILERIVEYAELTSEDMIVEIGPGTGNLTVQILKKNPQKVFLLEADPEMVAYLENRFSEEIKEKRLIVYLADAKCFDYEVISAKEFKILGNLPYNQASLIVERVIFFFTKVPLAIFMVQKEVAERWQSRESWLSFFIQTFFDIEYLMTVPPRFFFPRPKVHSAVIKLKRKQKKEMIAPLEDYKNFLIRLFTQKRKALKHKMGEEILQKANIPPQTRAEELTLEKVWELYQLWQKNN